MTTLWSEENETEQQQKNDELLHILSSVFINSNYSSPHDFIMSMLATFGKMRAPLGQKPCQYLYCCNIDSGCQGHLQGVEGRGGLRGAKTHNIVARMHSINYEYLIGWEF